MGREIEGRQRSSFLSVYQADACDRGVSYRNGTGFLDDRRKLMS
jgi:hypothetical protein